MVRWPPTKFILPSHSSSIKHYSVWEEKDPGPLFPGSIEDVADLLPLPGALILLVATGDDSVYPGEVGRAQVLEELVRAALQPRAGSLVLLSPGKHSTSVTGE